MDSSTAEPLPAIDLVGTPPLSDDDLDAYLAWAVDHAWADDPPDADPLAEVDDDPGAYRDDLVAALPVYRWTITSLDDAEWAMARLAEAAHHLEVLEAQRREWLRTATERIDRWHVRASRRSQHTAAVMTAKLERFALEQRAADPKVKSVPLPSGVVRTTEVKPTAKVLDDYLVAATINRGLTTGGADGPWIKALSGAGVKVDDVIVESTKVHVVPLRKIVTVGEVPTGQVRWDYTLACGDEHAVVIDGSEPAPPTLGEALPCTACTSDAIDGAPRQVVVEVQRTEMTEWRVIGPDGKPIPGTSVDLGGTVAKAVPGA